MNGEDRKKLISNYKKELKKKEKYDSIKKELNELATNPAVKRYLELLDASDDYNYEFYIKSSNDDLLNFVFRNLRFEGSCNIYIYVGAYKYNYEVDIEHGSNDYRVDGTNYEPDYYLYKCIEGYGEYKTVKPEKKDAFEKENIVLHCKRFKEYDVQERYAKLVVEEGLVTARKKIAEEFSKPE